MYTIATPTGVVHNPPRGRCWTATEPEFIRLLNDNRIHFPNDGNGRPRSKKFKFEETGLVPMTLWLASDVGDNQTAKREILALFPDDNDPFGTPKPERLIETIIHIATKPGDLVLDSFLGSGTTAAVAHKMGRRYIGVEMGQHAVTHCAPRLKKVIEGEQGGISQSTGWSGGGGFTSTAWVRRCSTKKVTSGKTSVSRSSRLTSGSAKLTCPGSRNVEPLCSASMTAAP